MPQHRCSKPCRLYRLCLQVHFSWAWYNVSDFGTQNVYAVGTSNVYQNGLLTSSGSAAGPANIETNSQSAVAFSPQGGLFPALLWQ
jgi:hypothetical protein